MPVMVPTPRELRAMPEAEREQWLARMPVREVIVVREVVREERVAVPVGQYMPVIATRGVVVDPDGYPEPKRHHLLDRDVVRCPLCGAWTVGVCHTGHPC